MLDNGRDWLLVAPDGRIDGSVGALARVVAWRTGDQVTTNSTITRRRRVPNLWRSVNVEPRVN
jgi:hypothetical protein